jgi:pimeloyl-ACP methyl ester carboxylesterase
MMRRSVERRRVRRSTGVLSARRAAKWRSLARVSQLAERLLFLPGALGDTTMWQPVAEQLHHPAARSFIGWPGFGGVPPDPSLRGVDDLVTRLLASIDGPVDVLAQSMGGVIALCAALARPEHVRHLVLAVTSGGLDVAALGGSDWRAALRAAHPELPPWFERERRDLSDRLHEIRVPVLLLWGDDDPISPVAVGERLASKLPHAQLVVVAGGTHDLVRERAGEIAPHVEAHLRKEAP